MIVIMIRTRKTGSVTMINYLTSSFVYTKVANLILWFYADVRMGILFAFIFICKQIFQTAHYWFIDNFVTIIMYFVCSMWISIARTDISRSRKHYLLAWSQWIARGNTTRYQNSLASGILYCMESSLCNICTNLFWAVCRVNFLLLYLLLQKGVYMFVICYILITFL